MNRLLHLLLGDRGERAAARHLKNLGYRIVARQYRSRHGEIDIIALHDQTIVFVEVKTRTNTVHGQPYEAVDTHKQRQLSRTALEFLRKKKRFNQRARFDVVSIIWPDGEEQPQIQHFQNAFDSTEE